MCHILLSVALWDPKPVFNHESCDGAVHSGTESEAWNEKMECGRCFFLTLQLQG